MPLPTEAEIQAQISAVVDLLEETRLYGHSSSPNYVTLWDTAMQAIETPLAERFARTLAAHRASFARTVEPAVVAELLDPLLLTYAEVRGLVASSGIEAIEELRDDLHSRSKSVQTRTFTFGSVTAGGGNTGNGTVNRLTVDRYGYDLEDQAADTKTFECVQDEFSGAPRAQEVFQVSGGSRAGEIDLIDMSSSGLVLRRVPALSALDSQNLIDNPSWDRFGTSGGALSSLPGWTAATGSFGTEIERDENNYYRDYQGAPDNVSLKFTAAAKVTQDLSVRRASLDPRRPYYMQVAYNRAVGSGAGDLTIRCGANSKAVALSAQTGWNILRLDLDENLWFDTFNTGTLDIEVELSGTVSGSVLIDDLIFAPMTRFDGAWYAIVGGATRFLREDVFTFADSETGAKIQHWLWRGYGRRADTRIACLPSSGTPTWSDP